MPNHNSHNQYSDPELMLPPEAAIADDNQNPRRRRALPGSEPELGQIVEPDEQHALANLILFPKCRQDILTGLHAIQMRSELERVWNISNIQPQRGRCILNFYGPPGTGKTRAALGVALQLGKCLYQVDYSAIISKYLGDTAKHITGAFRQASELDAVLFMDEADSLLSKRINMDQSCATSINQNRNTLMQCLDRFNGVVIVTTNLFENYDPALLRRISRHIKFALPDRSMRVKLFKLHLPNLERVEADMDTLAEIAKGLSGGDILNVCLNAIYTGSTSTNPEDWKVTQDMLTKEIAKVKTARRDHGSAAPVQN